MRRVVAITMIVGLTGCGVPSVPEAVRRSAPPAGATEVFGRSYADVYASAKEAIAREQATPEWKELAIVHDDPDGGVLVAERRLEGIVPGVRVRDLWSFYFVRRSADRTAVTFVLESSDQPRAGVGVRSWAKARTEVFPAMVEALGPPPGDDAASAGARPAESDSRSTSMRGVEATGGSEPRGVSASAAVDAEPRAGASAPRTPPAPVPPRHEPAAHPAIETETASAAVASGAGAARTAGPAPSLARLYAALQGSEEWRRTAARRRLAGDEIVTVGDWAQLEVRGGSVAVAFPTYPAPPAYDVARLIRFLGESGFQVEVLPGSAFRTP